MAAQIQPPAKGMTPQQYFIYLVNSGVPQDTAMNTVQQQYGPMKNKDDQAKDAQGNQTVQTIAAGAGMIGGYLITDYIKDNAGKWWNKVTGKKVTGDAVLDLDKMSQVSQTGDAASGTLGIKRPVPEVNASTPEVVSVKGDSAVIKTPDGGTQTVPKEALNDSEFWGNVNWSRVGEGGLALAQMYGAYKSFKSGDKVGGSINMAAGVGNLATATGAVATGAEAGTLGAEIIPGLNIVAGAYGGYQTSKMIGDTAAGSQRTRNAAMGGAASGAAIGSVFGPIGLAVGAAVGGLAGAVGSWTGSHKGKAQFMRDSIRGVLQQGGILDKDYKGTLANGQAYDFGKDGKALKWKEIDKISAANPKSWNSTIPLTDALAAAYGFVGQKASDISAWYGKAAVSNAGDDPTKAIKNAQHFAQQQGITYDQIKAKLDEAIADNRINQNQYDYYMGGARQLTAGVKAPSAPSGMQNPTPIPKSPMPPPQAQPAQPQGKLSIRDVLTRKMGTAQ